MGVPVSDTRLMNRSHYWAAILFLNRLSHLASPQISINEPAATALFKAAWSGWNSSRASCLNASNSAFAMLSRAFLANTNTKMPTFRASRELRRESRRIRLGPRGRCVVHDTTTEIGIERSVQYLQQGMLRARWIPRPSSYPILPECVIAGLTPQHSGRRTPPLRVSPCQRSRGPTIRLSHTSTV